MFVIKQYRSDNGKQYGIPFRFAEEETALKALRDFLKFDAAHHFGPFFIYKLTFESD